MNYSRFSLVLFTSVVCLTVPAADASAQARARGGGQGHVIGRAVPRGSVRPSRPVVVRPGIAGQRFSPRLRSSVGFYRPYYYGYRPGVRIGIFTGYGYPYYRYPYGYYGYGYPYPAYGYPYGYSYANPYPYSYGGAGYGSGSYGYDYAVGGVKIQGAPHDAQVYVDGYYTGIVDDFDGPFQRLELEAGTHQIEVRAPGLPPLQYDVNVQPGRTLTIHVR